MVCEGALLSQQEVKVGCLVPNGLAVLRPWCCSPVRLYMT